MGRECYIQSQIIFRRTLNRLEGQDMAARPLMELTDAAAERVRTLAANAGGKVSACASG